MRKLKVGDVVLCINDVWNGRDKKPPISNPYVKFEFPVVGNAYTVASCKYRNLKRGGELYPCVELKELNNEYRKVCRNHNRIHKGPWFSEYRFIFWGDLESVLYKEHNELIN